jgi:hypothetical protein
MIVLNIQAKDQNINTQGWCNDAAVFLNSYCISMMRNRSLTYREKKCRRGRLGRGKTISRSSKYFAATVYTTF